MKRTFIIGFLFFAILACQVTSKENGTTATVEPLIATIVPILYPTPTNMVPVLSPEIVFVSDRDGDEEIYTMTSEGNNVKQLTENQEIDWNPKWSPDNKLILFESERSGYFFPYIMNSDGTNQRPISEIILNEYHLKFKWSPDSQSIASWNEKNIFIVKASDGSIILQKQAMNNEAFADIAWSANGDQIAFAYKSGDNSKIAIMGSDGSAIKHVAELNDFIQLISWSPDGGKIAVSASCGQGCGAAIFVMSTDGTELRKLTNSGPYWIHGWTLDGKYILSELFNSEFLIRIEVLDNIHAVDDPTSAEHVTTWYVNSVFSPNGQRIVFPSFRDGQGEIYIVNIDGSGLSNLTQNPANDASPDWEAMP